MNDILFQESELEQSIISLENKKNEMLERFNNCTNKLKIIDGESEVWKSKAQEALKQKKEKYISSFSIIIDELEKEIQLLKLAKKEFIESENIIDKNIVTDINDI